MIRAAGLRLADAIDRWVAALERVGPLVVPLAAGLLLLALALDVFAP